MYVTLCQEFDLVREAAQLLAFRAGTDVKRFSVAAFQEPGGITPTRELIEAAHTLDALVNTLFDKLALTPQELALFTPDLSCAYENSEEENSLLCPFKSGCLLGFDEIVRRVRSMDDGDIRAYLIDEAELLAKNESGPSIWENRDEHVFMRQVLAHPDWTSNQKCHLLQVCTDYHAYFDRAAAILARCMDALLPLLPRLAPLVETYAKLLAQQEPGLCPQTLASVAEMAPSESSMLIRPQLSWPRSVVVRIRRPDPVNPTPVDVFLHDVRGMFVYFGLYVSYLPDALTTPAQIDSDALPALLKALSDKSKFDILSILAKESCYAAQLAQRLSLSPATISHHMNVLLSHSLVSVSEQDTRIYYRTNPDRLRAMLRALEAALVPR